MMVNVVMVCLFFVVVVVFLCCYLIFIYERLLQHRLGRPRATGGREREMYSASWTSFWDPAWTPSCGYCFFLVLVSFSKT